MCHEWYKGFSMNDGVVRVISLGKGNQFLGKGHQF